jgi:hypothetical protein
MTWAVLRDLEHQAYLHPHSKSECRDRQGRDLIPHVPKEMASGKADGFEKVNPGRCTQFRREIVDIVVRDSVEFVESQDLHGP